MYIFPWKISYKNKDEVEKKKKKKVTFHLGSLDGFFSQVSSHFLKPRTPKPGWDLWFL